MALRHALRAAAVLMPLLAAPALASPVLVTHFANEEAFRAHLAAQGRDVVADLRLIAQGRSGDNTAGGPWELGLMLPDKTRQPAASAQFLWPQSGDGKPWVPFTLSREGDTMLFTVGDVTLRQKAAGFGDITALALQAQAIGRGETTILRSLELDGERVKEGNVNAEADNADFALLEGIVGDFTLAGEARLRWAHDLAKGDPSRLMFQMSGYALAPTGLLAAEAPQAFTMETLIPEPTSGLMLLAASAGLLCLRNRRLHTGPKGDGSGGRI